MGCLLSAKYNMKATILHNADLETLPEYEPPYGEWVENQHPLTGQIVRIWIPTEITPDNPSTPDVDETVVQTTKCLARGITYRTARDEKFGENYRSLDGVDLWLPKDVVIDRRDRVTNIKDKSGNIVWVSEFDGEEKRAMMFNVIGVTPVIDMFGTHIENYVVLERAEV